MKKLLFSLLLSFPLWVGAQEYRLVSIPIRYHYSFNNGYADGSGTCSSCWIYVNRIPGLLETGSLEKLPEQYLTDKGELAISFYEKRTKTVNDPFGQEDYCASAQYKTKDDFTNKQVSYCQARVHREDVVMQPGSVVTLGNGSSQDLSEPDHPGALSAVKVWMLPNIASYEGSLGYCKPLFPQQGIEVSDGHWEYLIDEETSWSVLDGKYAGRYPLDVSLETLDQNTSASLRQARFLKLRFVLHAEGGGEFGGFNTATTSSSTEVPGSDTAILGPYNFTVYRCSPDLSEAPEIVDVRCAGESSGGFGLRFSRGLYETHNEKMLLMLYKVIGQEFVFLESQTLYAGDLAGDAFNWTNTLGVGTYKVRWMTKEGGDDPESIPDAYKESEPFVIGEPAPLQLTAEGLDILCKGGSTGKITLTPRGGVPPYQFSLDGVNWTTTAAFSGLASGEYTPRVRDANGCEMSSAITLEEPGSNVEAALLGASDPTAHGKQDGVIDVLVSGGIPPYRYLWQKDGDLFSDEEDLKGIGEGSYAFQAFDANGCATPVQVFQLTAPDPLGLVFIAETDSLLCAGETTVLRARGTGSASAWDNSYTYRWANGSTEAILPQAGRGTHEVTVFDKYGNSFSAAYELYGPEPLTAEPVKSDVLCKGLDNGSIQLKISGGTPPYNVSWIRLEDPSFSANGAELQDLPYGNYVYRITDRNGCRLDNNATPIPIGEPENEMSLIGVQRAEITAFDADDGALQVTVNGGTAPYRYEWIGPDGFMATTREISGLKEGIYTLLVADRNAGDELLTGCFLIEDFELKAPDPLRVAVAVTAPISCNGEMDALLYGEVTGGTMPYALQWYKTDQDGGEVAVGAGEFIEGLGAGNYVVHVTDHYGNSAISDTVVIRDPEPLEIVAFELDNASCTGMENGSVSVTVKGGVPPYRIAWDNGVSGAGNHGIAPGSYGVSITDTNGCNIYEQYSVGADSDLSATVAVLSAPISDDRNDGVVRIEISGGASPYEVFDDGILIWSGSGNVCDIPGLSVGDHRFEVNDAKGCAIMLPIRLSPADLVMVEVAAPSCPGVCDGAINVVISEFLGNASVLWSDGSTDRSREGMCPGNYVLDVRGEDGWVNTYQIDIPETAAPAPGIPEVVYLCSGAKTVLKAGGEADNYRFEWYQEGELMDTSSSFTLWNQGEYELVIVGEQCSWRFPFTVQFTDEVQVPEFVMATDVFTGEEVLAIDVTTPVPDHVEWHLPAEAVITGSSDDGVSFYINAAGEYEIGMSVSKGSCNSTVVKKIRVMDPDPETTAVAGVSDLWISAPKLYPNPVASYFNLEVELQQTGPLSVKVYSLSNNQMVSRVFDSGKRSYHMQVGISGAPPGMYAVLIETQVGSKVYKVVKS